MNTKTDLIRSMAMGLALGLGTLPVLAEKPPHAGGGKPSWLDQKGGERGGLSMTVQIGGYFTASQRRAVVEYYEPRFKAGQCPPGLAKKNNGCLPPGQAKPWRKGSPLPADTVAYPVPDGVTIRLGLPPEGHKFVRVATDILLIAVGTGLVIDAIEDLSQL